MPYTGKLDEEQRAWLRSDLEATPGTTPVCIASHIPILCACEFFDGDLATSGNWVVPGAWMHIDAGWLRELFLAHPNVRACLSGHAHQHDRVDYLGVRYACDGAVSGNWWYGDYLNCPPSYVMVDFFADGSIETEFVAYDRIVRAHGQGVGSLLGGVIRSIAGWTTRLGCGGTDHRRLAAAGFSLSMPTRGRGAAWSAEYRAA